MSEEKHVKLDRSLERGAGLLLPISSLSSPYGIGTLGDAAYKFVDFLVDAGQKYWQVLPVGPTSYGDSPYQSFSAFAGNPYYIDLDYLVEEGLLTKSQIKKYPWGDNKEYVDYATMFESRFDVLRMAYENSDFEDFGAPIKLRYTLDQFVGVRFALFCYSTKKTGGKATFKDFKIELL